jgi:DNA-binding phage protein
VTSNTVVRDIRPLTKDRVKALVASGIQREARDHGIEEVAIKAGCSRRCIEKALSHETLPEAHLLGNILLLDDTALHEWFDALGFIAIKRDAAMSPDMVTLSHMGRAMAEFIEALSDGKRTHTETLELADVLRPLVPRLTQIVHEADGLRNVA